LLDGVVEIPLIGAGLSLKVAVAGSLAHTSWPASCDQADKERK
jgi:hypothetical protein